MAVNQIIDQFQGKKIIVVGDVYLDEYIYCSPHLMSPEAPVMRVLLNTKEYAPGCAGNIALAFSHLGAKTILASVIGDDDKAKILLSHLKNVETRGIIMDNTRRTGSFSRIILEQGNLRQHTIRIDAENNKQISLATQDALLTKIEAAMPADLVFIADYDESGGNGIVTSDLREKLKTLARKHNPKLAGMSRSNNAAFNDVDILFMNLKEAIAAKGSKDLHFMLRDKNVSISVVTKDKEGMSVITSKEYYDIPSFATKIIDTCGAGDALATAFSLAVLANASLEDAGLIASHAAAIACSKFGTAPVFAHEIASSLSLHS